MWIILLIWKGGEIGSITTLRVLRWKRSIQNALRGATQELEVMFCTSKKLGILSWRLTIYAKSYVSGSVIGVETEPIDKGLVHLLVSLSSHLHI